MSTDGGQACGYNCMMGTDGHVVCANTSDGVCAMGANGRVSCSSVGPETSRGPAAASPPPTCRLNSDGSRSCGYNCRMGSDGHFECARTPDGVCAMGANGRAYCSQ